MFEKRHHSGDEVKDPVIKIIQNEAKKERILRIRMNREEQYQANQHMH